MTPHWEAVTHSFFNCLLFLEGSSQRKIKIIRLFSRVFSGVRRRQINRKIVLSYSSIVLSDSDLLSLLLVMSTSGSALAGSGGTSELTAGLKRSPTADNSKILIPGTKRPWELLASLFMAGGVLRSKLSNAQLVSP